MEERHCKISKADNPLSPPVRICVSMPSGHGITFPNVCGNPKHLTTLKGGLLALEATATAAATETTTSATAATTTATTVTETATATTTATEATTATATATTTAATEATAATVVVTGLSVVETDGTTLEVGAVQLVESVLGILNGVEGDISEALRTAGLPRRQLELWL